MNTPWFCSFFSFFFCSGLALAHPTSYEGGFALMSEMNPANQEVSMIYSPKYWLGAGVVTMRSPEAFNLVSSQFGLLAKRWNLPEAQGNLYLLGGLGHGVQKKILAKQDFKEGLIYRYGVQVDFETRRLYSFARYIEHRFSDNNTLLNHQLTAAIGFAPYLAEFNELNSWVILKLMLASQLKNPMFIPMLRFFYKNFLWEVGQDFDGNSQFNFMIRF